jgi:hypothetical protein
MLFTQAGPNQRQYRDAKAGATTMHIRFRAASRKFETDCTISAHTYLENK